jgi:hypothetical protein
MALRIITHDGKEPITVQDRKTLTAVLEATSDEARSKNLLSAVVLYAENRNSITMVVGGSETVLGFDYGHRDPPYYSSKGESDDDEPILTCFLTFQHHTEFPRRSVIPYTNGMNAVTDFLDSGNLPTCISWEEV